MMYRLLIVILPLQVIVGCNKPLPNIGSGPFDYTITGVNDTSMSANDNFLFVATINVTSGNPANQPVTITFRGVPANVTIQNDSLTFRLNHELNDSFGAHNATPGTYPMQAIFNSPGTATKTYNFSLIITPPINRVAKVIGGYVPSNSCVNNVYISCEIDSLPGSPGTIMLIDRTSPVISSYGTYDTAYGIVDCCSNTFVIPSQRVQGATVQGYGSFNGLSSPYSEVTLTRTIITDTATYSCIVTLSQN